MKLPDDFDIDSLPVIGEGAEPATAQTQPAPPAQPTSSAPITQAAPQPQPQPQPHAAGFDLDSLPEIRSFRMADGEDIDVDERAIARLRQGQMRNPFAPIGTDREAERASVSRKVWKEAGLPEKYGRSQKERDEVSRLILDAYDREQAESEAARAARQNVAMAQLDATRPAFEAQYQQMAQTQRELDYMDALKKAEAARPDLGVFGHKYLEAVASAGRDVGAGELIARQLPVLGAFIDADDAMVNNNFRRFMNGEFKDSLAMGNAARNMGVPEDVIADVQRRAWSGERTAAGFPIVDQKKAAEEWRKVIGPMYMAREAAKGRAVETLQEAAPLTATQEILSGAMTLPKMVVDLTPLGAGITAIPKIATQAERLIEKGDSEGTALAKSAASVGGEYFIWNKLGKVIDALPGVGNAVKSAGQVLARNRVTGNVIARNAGQILEMNAKSGLTELVNDVVGMGKADGEEKKEFSEWFQDFVSVPGNAKKMLMMLPAHLLMKGVGKGKQLLSKEGREAAGAVDVQREIVKATIGEEAARGLSDADVQNIYKIVSSSNLTEKSISDTISFIEGKAGTENRQGALRELRKQLREERVQAEGQDAAREGAEKLWGEAEAKEEQKAEARAENEAAREAKRTAKAGEAADAARAEQERLQAEAEQEAAIKERAEEEAKPNAAVGEMKAAEAESRKQEANPHQARLDAWPEYSAWLKKNGMKNNAKNWNKFVAQNELDPGMKMETPDQAKKRGAKEFERGLAPDEELAAFDEYSKYVQGEEYQSGRSNLSFDEWLAQRHEGAKNGPTIAPREEGTTTPPNGADAPQGAESGENRDTPRPLPPPNTAQAVKEPPPEPKKPFGTGDSSHGQGKYSRDNYDKSKDSSGATGAATWHWQNGGRVYNLPVDFELTRPGGPVVLKATDSATERLKQVLNGYKLKMTKTGKIEFEGTFRGTVPTELRELLGRELKIGDNPDAPSKDDLYSVNKGQFADETRTTWGEVEEAVAADRENYHKWKERQQRADRRASEEKKLEKKVRSGKATQNELDILRHRNMMEDYLEEGGSRTSDQYKAMERDLEVLQESGTYDYEGLSKAKDAADRFRDAEWENAIGDIESGEGDFSPSDQYVKPFTRENLQGAKKGDIIHFDHDEVKYELDRYDPETGVMEVYRSDENGVKRRFKVSRNGVEEIRHDGKGQKGVVQDNAGDAGGGGRSAPGAAGGEARGAEGAAGRGSGGTVREKYAELTSSLKRAGERLGAATKAEGESGGAITDRIARSEALIEAYRAELAVRRFEREHKEERLGQDWGEVKDRPFKSLSDSGIRERIANSSTAIAQLKEELAEQARTGARKPADLTLESLTPAEQRAEQERIAQQQQTAAQKAEMEARRTATLKGGTGDLGQQTLDLGGAEGEQDLFNRREARNPEQEIAERLDLRRLDPKRRSDPKVLEWAKKNKRTITDGKVTPDALRAYDEAMTEAAAKVVNKRWFPDMKIVTHKFGEKIKRGQHVLDLRDTAGHTLGWFDPKSKEVHLLPGADPQTVAHEIMWHGTRDYFATRAAKGDALAQKVLDKMKDVELHAPQDIKDIVNRLYARGGVPVDRDTLLNEYGAWFTMKRGGYALEKAMQKAENRNWFARGLAAVKDMYKNFLIRHGKNRVDLSQIDTMTRDQFVDFLTENFAGGKTLGNIGEPQQRAVSTKETWLGRFRRRNYDQNAAIRDVQRDIERTKGVKIAEADNVEMANALKYGLKEAANIEIDGKIHDFGKTLHEAGIHIADVEYYAALKAAAGRDAKIDARNVAKLEADMKAAGATPDEIAAAVANYRSTNGSHIDPREARRMVAEIENGPDAAKYKEALKKLREIRDETLQVQVDAGLVSKESADQWRAEEPDYVPFKNEYDPETGEWNGRGTSRDYSRPEHRMAKGRQSAAGDIAAHIFMDHQAAKHRAIENAVRQKLAKLVRANPELGTVEKLRKDAYNVEGNDPNVVTFKENGDSYAIRLEGTRGAAIANAFTQRNQLNMKWADAGFSVFGKKVSFRNFAHMSAGMATRYSLTFSLRNTLKDNIELANIVYSERGFVAGSKFMKDYVANRWKMKGALARYVTTGKIDTSTAEGAILDRYIKAGGLIAGGVRAEGFSGLKERLDPSAIEKEVKRGASKARSAAKYVFNSIGYLNEYAEMATRVGVFATDVKGGKSDAEAALFSRRATVDFNRHGDWTPAFNMFRLFSNSTLGATARAAAAFGKSKYGKRAALLMFANGLTQALVNYYVNRDEDKEREARGEATGKDMGEYDRRTSLFYFRSGDKVYKVAQHESPFSLFKYAGDCVGRWLCGELKGADVAKNLGVSTAEIAYNFLPMGQINLEASEGGHDNDLKSAIISGICPSVVQPIAELFADIDFKGDSIYRRKFDKYTPDSANGKKHTAEWAKSGAAWLNEASGGNEGRAGKWDIAPETLQHLAEGYGKNMLRDVSTFVSLGQAIVNWDFSGLDPRNTPIKRDFVRPIDGNTRRYYEQMDNYRADRHELLKMATQWTPEERKAYVQAHPWARNPEVNKAIQKIGELQKYEDGFVKNGRGWVKRKTPPTEEQKAKWNAARLRYQARFLEYAEKHGGEH